jgi:hypothetical protein
MQNFVVYLIIKNLLFITPEDYRAVINDYSDMIYGPTAEEETWELCSSYATSNMGYVTGGLFAERHFTEDDKQEVVYNQ